MVFRSAFNYLSQAGSNLLSGNEQHPLVGQTLEIGGRSLVVRSLLAEGGYALVFSVQDSRNGEWFALKRQLAADRIAADAVAQEIRILKKLSGHQAIIRFFHATQTAPDKRSAAGPQHFAEFMLLTELCSGGPLIDYIRKAEPLNVQQICKIIYALASAVQHMHDRNPPITHRDIKIENLLIDTHGFIKLCDFGSATTDIYRPDEDWSVMMRNQLEEEMAKFTTPMYRAPEILETYQNYPIGPPQDIWALGCVLFYLCFRIHPFEDSAKLRIINAKYNLPIQSPFQIFHDLIKRTLQPDPYSRPSIQDLCEQIEDIALALNLDLSQPFLSPEQLETLTSAAAETSAPQQGTSNSAPNQPTTSRLIFDQGMNLIKTIKEKTPPVSSISEQLRTHLGFDAAPLNQPNSRGPSSQQQQAEKRGNVAPPRPLAPPTIQTRTSQLPTQKESVEEEHRQPISSTSSSTSKAEEKKPTHHQNSQLHKEEKPRKKLTQEQQQPINVGATTTDFFSTLDWNTSEKQKGQQKPKKQHIYDLPKSTSPSAENEYGILGDLQQPFSNSIGQEKNNRVGVDHLLAEFGLSENDAHSQVPPSHPPSHRPHEDGVGKAESSAELDVLKLLEEEEIGISSQATAMFRNKSAPDFASAPTTILKGKDIPTAANPKTSDDIFAEFLSGMETHSQGSQYQRPNYSRKNFDKTEEFKMEQKTKTNTGNVAFDDLFSFQGFTSSRQSNVKTLADLTKERDAQEMDPIALKIKYWTAGKQRNIRALLGSLSEVLWEDAKPNWSQPSVAELFEADKIKKHYRRACLVVHPDKQLGTEQELLAKAIFTELNDAWNEFLKNTQ